ncbi:hypothetical protein [Bacillus cereus]|uniref:hypothetical protein n=1 Tax=Bacillus cereus TaxID=1396 RepID=UPI001596827C|nr:hypothetical protein [Bacillus cereus]
MEIVKEWSERIYFKFMHAYRDTNMPKQLEIKDNNFHNDIEYIKLRFFGIGSTLL